MANIFGKSDIGRVRPTNQDNFDYGTTAAGVTWAVVCDGMGGTNGGDIASSVAVESIKDSMNSDFSEAISHDDVERLLKKAIDKANFEIFNKAQKEPELRGMGTTVVLLAIVEDKIHIAYVGDSRAYMVRSGEIEQLTVDHSMVQQLIDDGEITDEEAKDHPQKNIITRALGISRVVKIDYLAMEKLPGDLLLACTDGLTNYLDQNDLLTCVRDNAGEALINEMIAIANERGGNDNITAVVLGD